LDDAPAEPMEYETPDPAPILPNVTTGLKVPTNGLLGGGLQPVLKRRQSKAENAVVFISANDHH
jgi:hypothetical protein